MGKRYYCEFCDKSFADNPTNKRGHLKGVRHQRMKKLHYDSFREPEEILAEEASKQPCKRFQAGICRFGENCHWSHMTDETRLQLEHQAQAKKEIATKKRQAAEKEIRLEDWLAKRQKSSQGAVTHEEAPVAPDPAPVYVMPPGLMRFPNLPPSLLPPPPGLNLHASVEEWG